MTDTTNPRGNADTNRSDPPASPRWTDQDLSDMQQFFWRNIGPDAAADGIDVETEKLTYSWLADNDYRTFAAALRRHHDLTFDDFWRQHIAPDATTEEYDWGTTDAETIDALEHFLDRRASRYNLSESSVDTLRYRLNGYVRAFEDANDHARLLQPVARESDRPAYEAVDEVFAAFDWLNEASGKSETTIKRTADIVESFYSHLVSRQIAATNPASGLSDEFKWDTTTDGDTPSLTTEHVQALHDAAQCPEDELLIIALAAWGLRANEVAALHIDQIDRQGDDVPRIEFDERKNGPGSVSILYGMDVLDERLGQMSERTEWNGYLWPSTQSGSDHISRQTVWRRFHDLAQVAGLPEEIDGERPSPQLCRRFWYDRYSETLQEVIGGLEEIAAEQGSSDPEIVLNNYLSEDRARRLRRESMRDNLYEAFCK